MDAILSYLNNMFVNLPDTPEVRRAREELQQMMEDKYQELRQAGKTDNEAVGQVIAEFGNLEELGEELGISSQVSDAHDPQKLIAMSEGEVQTYLSATALSARKISFGVALCILSAVPLILIKGLQDRLGLADNLASAIGLGALLLMVAIGVYNFIVYGAATERYDALERSLVSITPGLRTRLLKEREVEHGKNARRIALGVVLILAGVALVAILGALELAEVYLILSVGLLLACVALAVSQFIQVGMRWEAFDKLLNTGDYTAERRRGNSQLERFSGPYWMLALVVYLGWSFYTGNWGFTWIVWPIAGVLYGLIGAILGAAQRENRS
jgi:protein-S-isoprenylcysteine O-methyltransferase Ste14